MSSETLTSCGVDPYKGVSLYKNYRHHVNPKWQRSYFPRTHSWAVESIALIQWPTLKKERRKKNKKWKLNWNWKQLHMGMVKLISLNNIVVKTLNPKTNSFLMDFCPNSIALGIAVTFDLETLILCFKIMFCSRIYSSMFFQQTIFINLSFCKRCEGLQFITIKLL